MWKRIIGGYERDEDRVNELWGEALVEGGGQGVGGALNFKDTFTGSAQNS